MLLQGREKTISIKNKISITILFIILLAVPHNTFAQSPIDSLEIYDVYTQFDDVRRILANYISILGEENEALIKQYTEQIEKAKKNNSIKDETGAFIKLGDIYFKAGLYENALNNYFSALKEFESIHDTINAAIVNIKIGRTYYFADLWVYKDEFILKGCKVLRESKDIELIAYSIYAEGNIEKDFVKARFLINKALSIQLDVVKQKPDDFNANEKLVTYLNAAGKYEDALNIAKKIGNDWQVVLILNNIGYFKVFAGKYDEAIQIFFKSLKICKEKRFKTLLRNTYDNLSRAYRMKGDWKKSDYYQKYQHYVEESLFTDKFALQASEFRVKYEAEKKQLENDFLKKEGSILTENIKYEKNQNFILFMSVIFISIFTGYIFLSRRKIKSSNSLLDVQNSEIKMQKEILENLNAELKTSEQNLKVAQATAHLANWEWDLINDVFTFSDELPKIFNIESAKLKLNFRDAIIDRIHYGDKEKFREYFYDSVDKINNEEREYRIIKYNEIHWIKAKRIAIRNDDGVILKVFGTIQDITEIKKEEEIKALVAAQQSFTRQLIESQEDERKRIAGELHDGIGQDILLIKNRAQLILQNENLEGFVLEQLNEINNSTAGMLSLVREISFNLRPAHLERLGLTETIISAIQKVADISQVNFSQNIDNIDNLFPNELEINIYRIIQEGINNIIKHSEALHAQIRVCRKDDEILINIIDDGKGFDLKKGINASAGFGLNNILNRVKILSGNLNITTEELVGTNLEVIIPLSKNE